MRIMPKLKLNKKQFLKSDNNCNICKNPLIIQVEYNLIDYEVVYKEGCLHCGFMDKSTLDISKQDIEFHIDQLLNKNICGTCNKVVIIDDIQICKKALVIFIYIRCLHCKTYYIIVKPCHTKEEQEMDDDNE